MKKLVKFLILTVVVLGIASCNSDNNANNTPALEQDVTFTAEISGTQEVPPTGSMASGSATLVYNPNTKIFTITATYSGVTAVAAHVHMAATGVSGGVIFPIDPFVSPINYISPVLTANQETDLNANLYYINIHSAAFPSGEIRGQFIKQ